MLLSNGYQGDCPPSFSCGFLGNISFPYTTTQHQDCGLLPIHNCDNDDSQKPKIIQLQNKGKLFEFEVESVTPLEFQNGSITTTSTCIFRDNNLYKLLQSKSCESFNYNYTFPPTFGFASFRIKTNTTLFMCNRTLHINPPTYMHNYTKCPLYDLYYQQSYIDDASRSAFTACANVLLPNKDFANADDPFTILTSDIPTEVNITEECAYCHFNQRGKCQIDSNDRFYCADSDSYGTHSSLLVTRNPTNNRLLQKYWI
jgi:hypothetical protein